MANQDFTALIDPKVALTAQAIASATTTTGTIIDTQNAFGVSYLLSLGSATVAGTFTPLLEESDASDMSGSNEVADAYLIGTEAGAALTVASTVKKLGYVGKKRYVRLKIVTTGGSVSGTVVALAALFPTKKQPIAQ